MRLVVKVLNERLELANAPVRVVQAHIQSIAVSVQLQSATQSCDVRVEGVRLLVKPQPSKDSAGRPGECWHTSCVLYRGCNSWIILVFVHPVAGCIVLCFFSISLLDRSRSNTQLTMHAIFCLVILLLLLVLTSCLACLALAAGGQRLTESTLLESLSASIMAERFVCFSYGSIAAQWESHETLMRREEESVAKPEACTCMQKLDTHYSCKRSNGVLSTSKSTRRRLHGKHAVSYPFICGGECLLSVFVTHIRYSQGWL